MSMMLNLAHTVKRYDVVVAVRNLKILTYMG